MSTTHSSMDNPPEHNAERKKQDAKDYLVYDFIYKKYQDKL